MTDSEQDKKRLAEQYSNLTDEALREMAEEAWTLTDTAKQALQAELAHRALDTALAMEPPAPEFQQRDLVTLQQFRDAPEALLAQGALKSAGIESFLGDETTIRMDWLWSNALGGIKLWVNREDAEVAAQVLGQEIPENFNVEGVGDFDQPRCPQCHSLDIAHTDSDKHWTCHSCGHAWLSSD